MEDEDDAADADANIILSMEGTGITVDWMTFSTTANEVVVSTSSPAAAAAGTGIGSSDTETPTNMLDSLFAVPPVVSLLLPLPPSPPCSSSLVTAVVLNMIAVGGAFLLLL